MNNWTVSVASIVVAAAVVLSGCGSAATETASDTKEIAEQEKQLAELKQQVADAEKKLAASRAKTTNAAESAPATRASAPAPAPRARSITVPAGTPIVVRTTTEISTNVVRPGDPFDASLEEPLVVGGTVIAPRRARVIGAVVEADKGGRVKGKAQLTVRVRSLVTSDGQIVDLNTNTVGLAADASKKDDALKVGIATGVGAAIGAIAGGGKGAAIGAGAGAGAGVGTVLLTRGDAAVLPAESVLNFQLATSATIRQGQ